ncbi:acyl-CoA dehydrogenase family protein [Aquisediminimonas profunda]|uniref:acyl-CoA dehydrogenase family protein n=1 Tax=Aquisediminimonas profunda TaxID=1550733 RepID=UPI001C62B143|nr:acyl-CoA dehydrogenase family protein [Aquisediminimonas profunda]
MDFELGEERRALRQTLRSFFQREAPTAEISRLDREAIFPREIYNKMAELGLCGITIPEQYGGNPMDEISRCVVMEEIARAGGCLIYAFAPSVAFCGVGIERYGSEEQKEKFLPGIASGKIRIAMGLSEPNSGSDLASLATSAVRDGDNYLINGQKIWTTGADTAEYIMAFVRTDREAPGHRGLSILLVDRTTPGISVRPIPKLAAQATHTCEVFFDNVVVPAANLLGPVGGGAKMIFSLLDAERVYVAAQACGIAQGAFEQALTYAKQRKQFGTEIINLQAVGHMLAEIASEIQASRLVCWHAAWRLDQGLSCSTEASIAKIVATEATTRCIGKAMQVMGGYSYALEFPLERFWRETKLYEIAGGTNQIQRNIIVKNLLARDDIDYFP